MSKLGLRARNSGPPRRVLRAPLLVAAGAGLFLALSATGSSGRAGNPGPAAGPGTDRSRTGATAPARTVPAPKKIYWGAWIGTQFTGTEAPWDMNAVTKFQRLTGKGLSLIHFASPFADCRSDNRCVPYTFPTAAFEDVRGYGAIPFFSWGSIGKPMETTTDRYALRTIIAGKHDAYIKAWATAAKRWGHPFFLQFDWEMNGRWYPWSEGRNGNRSGEYAQAWRHVHRIFTSVGATNASWVWCPNVDPNGALAPLYPLYPGDSYVDWTCLNGYNRDEPWRSFDELFGSTYDAVHRIAPTKPMVIGEIASTERGGSKAAWITDLLTHRLGHQPYSQVRGILWFNKPDSRYGSPIESSRTSRRAFARGIASPLYVANVLSSLGGRPIPPPG